MVRARLFLFESLQSSRCCNLAIVEQVRDGTTLRVRLLMPDGEHQMVNIALAGVRSARAATKQGESSEPWGEEVNSPSLLISSSQFCFLHRQNISQNLVYSSALSEYKYYLYRIQRQLRFKMPPTQQRLYLLAYLSEQVKSTPN